MLHMSQTRKIIVALGAVIVVVIIVVVVLLIITPSSPHFGFPSSQQASSTLSGSYKESNVLYHSGGSTTFASFIQEEGAYYNSSSNSVLVVEAEANNVSNARSVYLELSKTLTITNSAAVTGKYDGAVYTLSVSNISIGGVSDIGFAYVGKYVMYCTVTGNIPQSTFRAFIQLVISDMV